MNEFNKLKNIPAKFEDVSIYTHELELALFKEPENKQKDKLSAYTNVRHKMTVHHRHIGGEMVGDLYIQFRNQGSDFSSSLIMTGVIRASSVIDNNPRSIFCKLVQYMFNWMKEYAKENDVRDSKGELFVLPAFGYSKDDFTDLPVD